VFWSLVDIDEHLNSDLRALGISTYTANDLRGPDIIRSQTSKDDRALNVKYFGLDVHGHPTIHGPLPIALSGYHGTSETKDILWTSQLIGRARAVLAILSTGSEWNSNGTYSRGESKGSRVAKGRSETANSVPVTIFLTLSPLIVC